MEGLPTDKDTSTEQLCYHVCFSKFNYIYTFPSTVNDALGLI